jgi:DNA-binding transcriptional MerR regulator
MTRRTQLPDKLFFKIGEVADIVGVKPHALRYWETEFPALRPKKTRGAHRQYSRSARKRIRDLGRHQRSSPPEPRAQREVALRAELLGLRQQLAELRDQLAGAETEPVEAKPLQVTVHKVVPVTVSRGPEA